MKKTKFNSLQGIFKAFKYFSIEYRLKLNGGDNIEIIYALDNDVFSFILEPLKNTIHADLIHDDDIEFLNQQAIFLSDSMIKLSNRNGVAAFSTHAIEYKDTIAHLHRDTINAENTVKKLDFNKELIDDILKDIKNKKTIEDILKNRASDILHVLNSVNQIISAQNNLVKLMKKNKDNTGGIRSIMEINNNKSINTKNVLKGKNLNIKKSILKYKNSEPTLFALENDTIALMELIAFNEQNEHKKIILITNNSGIFETYKKYYNSYQSNKDIFAVRYPKHLIPFLSGEDSIFSNSQSSVLRKIESLLENTKIGKSNKFKKRELIEEKSDEITAKLKKLINLNNIDNHINDQDKTNDPVHLIDFKDALFSSDFKAFLLTKIKETKIIFIKELAAVPVFEELLRHQEFANKMEFFFRYPFVVNTGDDRLEKLINTLTKDILSGSLTEDILKIQDVLNSYHIHLINASVLNLMHNKNKALIYIENSRSIIEDNDINESYLLEGFIYRSNFRSIDDYNKCKKALNNIELNKSNKILEFRKNIELCILDVSLIMFENYKKTKYDKIDIPLVSKKLKKLLDSYDEVFIDENSAIALRAKIQLYIIALIIYIFQKYIICLQNDDTLIFNQQFFIDKKSIYDEFDKKERVAFVQIMKKCLELDLYTDREELLYSKNDVIKYIYKVINTDYVILCDYEKYFLENLIYNFKHGIHI